MANGRAINSQLLQLGERPEGAGVEVLQYVVVQHQDLQAGQALEVVGLQRCQVVREERQSREGAHLQEEARRYAAQRVLAEQQLVQVLQLRKGMAINLWGKRRGK